MRPILLLFMTAVLFGCASGSALLTGKARTAIDDFTTISILTAMPEGAEQIALVKASSDLGWSQQQVLDYAVEELKKQAAKVGANAIVLTDRGAGSAVTGLPTDGWGTTISFSEFEIVEGIAVYVK